MLMWSSRSKICKKVGEHCFISFNYLTNYNSGQYFLGQIRKQRLCSRCTFVFWISITTRHKLGGAVIANFCKPLPPPSPTNNVDRNHKHSNRTTLNGRGRGRAGRYFVLSFGNCPNIRFGQDYTYF